MKKYELLNQPIHTGEIYRNGKDLYRVEGYNDECLHDSVHMDALRGSKDQDKDIDAALAALQKDSGYLFEPAETPPPYAAGTGSGTVSHADKSADGVEAAFAALNPKLKF